VSNLQKVRLRHAGRTTLETALRLKTEFSDLSWVSVSNDVLVTGTERAGKPRKENKAKTKILPPTAAGGLGGIGIIYWNCRPISPLKKGA
jgi:hypothetical protein